MPFCQDGIQPLAIFDTTENKILTPASVYTRGRIRVDGWECAAKALSEVKDPLDADVPQDSVGEAE